jgi:site-specific DNA-cytosine methylase
MTKITKKSAELLHNRVVALINHPHEKIFKIFFLKMTPLGVKTCEEFNIFEAKKHFPDSRKAYFILKRKVAKIAF